MRLLIQRVRWARVRVAEQIVAEIGPGLLMFVGVERDDTEADARRCGRKAATLRIFSDAAGKMNKDIRQVGGSVLSVSQFTLCADTRAGKRPGFERAAVPGSAERLWRFGNDHVRQFGIEVREGIFGAHMAVELCNDGPVTIAYDTRQG